MPWNYHSLGTGAGLLGHHHCVLADSLPFCFAGHSGMILKWGCRYTSLLNSCVVCNGMEYIRHGVILQRASKSNIATRWAMKDSKKPMSWLAGGPCICFVSAIFGHVGVSLSQISFNFVWRKEVPCFAARTILYVHSYWLGNAEVETGTPGIAAALALAFVSNLFATLTPYVRSSIFLPSETFIAGEVISGLCTISCSFCWALHYCSRVVQGDGQNWHHPNQFSANKNKASWWRKVLFLQAGFIFMLAYYIQWLVVGDGLKKVLLQHSHSCCGFLSLTIRFCQGAVWWRMIGLVWLKMRSPSKHILPLTSLDEIFSRLAFVGPFPAQRFACLSRSLLLQNLEMSWFASAFRNRLPCWWPLSH